jgi:glycine/D-amino acid oxidase-like deaminating enzyme
VIGGGFYGIFLAEQFAARCGRVILLEREPELMGRASYSNQARVHNGYHYPRSVLTALRSRANFPRFVEEFRPAIDSTFDMIYAVSRRFSKVTSDQFMGCMRRIGAAITPAKKSVQALFNPAYVEAAFLTQEHAFNAQILREMMLDRLRRVDVDIRLQTHVQAVRPAAGERVDVEYTGVAGNGVLNAANVFCCGYAQLNGPGEASGLPKIALKHELTELALVAVPEPLHGLGVTVVDGPFFSLMPFPARNLYSLSHVRYTPHVHWYDGKSSYSPAYARFESLAKVSKFAYMIRDAARYLPSAAACDYRGSLWEVKTVLPMSETDDSRPILFRPHFGMPSYHLVMGGKIDNVYDVAEVVGRMFASVGG